jgi:hypothetical protein
MVNFTTNSYNEIYKLLIILTIKGDCEMTKATKGSQLYLQNLINLEKDFFNQAIFSYSPSLISFVQNLHIEWKSPLTKDNYLEYQDDFLNLYYEDEESATLRREQIRKYWPRNGPVWDGIGIVQGKNQKGIILVEAKGHIQETKSKLKANSAFSIQQITETIERTKKEFKSNSPIDPWLKEYYQLSN